MFAALINRAWEVKHADTKKGMSQKFEEHVRCLMATGSTARQTREGLILTAGQLLEDEECADYRSQLPTVEWFAKQREALGVECTTRGMAMLFKITLNSTTQVQP